MILQKNATLVLDLLETWFEGHEGGRARGVGLVVPVLKDEGIFRLEGLRCVGRALLEVHKEPLRGALCFGLEVGHELVVLAAGLVVLAELAEVRLAPVLELGLAAERHGVVAKALLLIDAVVHLLDIRIFFLGVATEGVAAADVDVVASLVHNLRVPDDEASVVAFVVLDRLRVEGGLLDDFVLLVEDVDVHKYHGAVGAKKRCEGLTATGV